MGQESMREQLDRRNFPATWCVISVLRLLCSKLGLTSWNELERVGSQRVGGQPTRLTSWKSRLVRDISRYHPRPNRQGRLTVRGGRSVRLVGCGLTRLAQVALVSHHYHPCPCHHSCLCHHPCLCHHSCPCRSAITVATFSKQLQVHEEEVRQDMKGLETRSNNAYK